MKKLLLILLCFPLISNASFPVNQSNTEQDISLSTLTEELIDDNLFYTEPGFCNNFANISFYFGVFWYFNAMIGFQLRYVSSEKILGEILMIFASVYSVLSFMTGVSGLFIGKKRWQSLFGILLSIPGLILTFLLIKYGFDFYE
ncbi:MAG: hypothetical protein ACKVJW_00550 [Flavobacteriales bacterium]|tara:strand:+ start:55 stop:486 length:432 start_codon:yes stop_codon:yes gene_type:complete